MKNDELGSVTGLDLVKVNTQYIRRIIIFACFAYSNLRKEGSLSYATKVSKFIEQHLVFFPMSYKVFYGPAHISSKEELRDIAIDQIVEKDGSDAYHIVDVYFQYPKSESVIKLTIDLREEQKYLNFLKS